MKFSRHNNPNKRRTHKKPLYSNTYIEERRNELNKLLAAEPNEARREMLTKAFEVSVNP